MKKVVSRFSVENFWFHSAEKFRGHPFNASENLGYRKILCILGGITFFRRKFLVSQCQKSSWASLQCFRKFGVSKIFMHIRGYHNFPSKISCFTDPKNLCIIGGITIFRRNFFCFTVPKNFVGEPSCAVFQKISGSQKVYG